MSSEDTMGSGAPNSPDPTAPAAGGAPVRRTRRRAATRPAGPPQPVTAPSAGGPPVDGQQVAASTTGTPSGDTPAAGTPAAGSLATGSQTSPATADTSAAESAPVTVTVAKRSGRRTSKKAAAAAPDDQAPATTVGDQQLPAGDQASASLDQGSSPGEAVQAPAKRSGGRRRATKATDVNPFTAPSGAEPAGTDSSTLDPAVGDIAAAVSGIPAALEISDTDAVDPYPADTDVEDTGSAASTDSSAERAATAAFSPVFQAPDPSAAVSRGTGAVAPVDAVADADAAEDDEDEESPDAAQRAADEQPSTTPRRRRSRGGRNRRKPSDGSGADPSSDSAPATDGAPASGAVDGTTEGAADTDGQVAVKPAKKTSKKSAGKKASKDAADDAGQSSDEQTDDGSGEAKDTEEGGGTSSSSRRRRRRRRSGDGPGDGGGDSAETVVKVREPRAPSDKITSIEGSTRMEAKKQRRRDGREAGRRRAPILSESEFLARRESVDRVMVVRQRDDVTQIAVLEDSVLVEHYVALDQQSSLIGNVYLGRVQNVLPSMEAAFIDIGKGRNAVLYAGEVNWDLVSGNQPRRIENALKSGQQILVQVSKDPVGHKGARLTSQISLPGRYLVYVPGGGSSGISRKLPDTERSRLKNLLKEILPDESGVIIRTAAEGASEEELTRDVRRLTERWAEIEKLVKTGKGPSQLYAEPDVTLRVVRDLFTEDFAKLVVSGDEAWETVNDYVSYVAPDLTERLERYDGKGDVFTDYRVDEQIAKALERKVWLPSGGSLVIDRTEAMTVVDVNTGKFTGSGGNLEQTVTKNNLEAAEEIVRQLRLRDIGGIIVIDFIDMVLENNRDLVLRRLVECLGRDRTRHQVAEVTSLGLVQMTRKRIGTGLVEAFSVPCEQCNGRGVVIEAEPVKAGTEEPAPAGRTSSKRASRQRSASRSEPEVEQVDPLVAERHSAAAAATAAIAAALHPETRVAALELPDEDRSGVESSVDSGLAELTDIEDDDDTYGFEPLDLDPRAGEPDGAGPGDGASEGDGPAAGQTESAPAKKSGRTRKVAAKKSTTEKATAKKSAAKKTAAKTTAAKATTAKKTAGRKTAAKKAAADPVADVTGAAPQPAGVS